jgi:hypothetical protein
MASAPALRYPVRDAAVPCMRLPRPPNTATAHDPCCRLNRKRGVIAGKSMPPPYSAGLAIDQDGSSAFGELADRSGRAIRNTLGYGKAT